MITASPSNYSWKLIKENSVKQHIFCLKKGKKNCVKNYN